MPRSNLFPQISGYDLRASIRAISPFEMVTGYVGAAATKSVVVGFIILAVSFICTSKDRTCRSGVYISDYDGILFFSSWVYLGFVG